jgi:crossover junction endodeoxyribonuclease RusA
MAKYTFTLPFPPSLNRIWRNGTGATYKSPEAKAYGWAVAAVLSEHDLPLLTGNIAVRLDLYRPRKQGDADNYAKVLLDYLQGRVYQNDNQIVDLHILRHDDKHNPRVDVTVEEAA